MFPSTDEDPSLLIENFVIVNLRGVSTKLYFNLIFTMQTYTELIVVTRMWVALTRNKPIAGSRPQKPFTRRRQVICTGIYRQKFLFLVS